MLLGFMIFLMGILFLFENIIPGFTINYDILWPSIFIIISLYNVLKDKKSNLFNNVLLFIGIFFLLKSLNIITKDIENLFFPLLVIIIGISIMLKSINFNNKYKINKVDKDGRLEY
ncbi:MAG TPA: hypothetical protein GX747_03250, partial [Tenericutes bacterium]|nr:hypothetical protein [Mycoplasmatota bacterium]